MKTIRARLSSIPRGLEVSRSQLNGLKRYHQNLSYLVTAVWPDEAANRRAEAIRILYVDKDREVTTLVKQTVQRQGWTLRRYSNGKTALNKLIDSDDQYDLVLLDYELSGLNGLN